MGNAEITPYFPEVRQHGGKAHEGHVADMLMQMALGSGHMVAAESCKLRLGITGFYLRDQRCRVHIPGRFTCYEEVFGHQPSVFSIQ